MPSASATPCSLPTAAALQPFTGERAWFPHEGRFGVFLHFGLYTLLGGEENDRMGYSLEGYARELMPRFCPQAFDADAWVAQIREAGASHLVLTTKHGEGFCLWDTATSDLKITATPFARDLVGELAEACHRGGLRLGLYIACADWYFRESGRYEQSVACFTSYFTQQLTELMTNYGRVDLLWFDGSSPLFPLDHMRDLQQHLRKLQPSLVINDRGTDHHDPAYQRVGDYVTPERFIPAAVGAEAPFIEVCDAMGQKGWGYHREQTFLSGAECVRRLSAAAGLGGNFLLNVEPEPSGKIRPECLERLAFIGKWLQAHRESVFGTRGGVIPVVEEREQNRWPLGVTTIAANTVYAHLARHPRTSECLLPGLSGEVERAELMNGTLLAWRAQADGLRLSGFPARGDDENPVVRITFREQPTARPPVVGRTTRLDPEAPTELRPEDARLLPGCDDLTHHRIERYANGAVSIGRWVDGRSAVAWDVAVEAAGPYRVFVRLGAAEPQAGARIRVSCGDHAVALLSEETGSYQEFRTFLAGELELPPGAQTLRLDTPEVERFGPNIHGLSLVPSRHSK